VQEILAETFAWSMLHRRFQDCCAASAISTAT
jgi:hypothetical protein